MPLLRDVVTAVGIELEGHGGHSGTMDEGRAIHVGLHAGICRPRRLAAVQPWPATAKTPLRREAGLLRYPTQDASHRIPATRWRLRHPGPYNKAVKCPTRPVLSQREQRYAGGAAWPPSTNIMATGKEKPYVQTGSVTGFLYSALPRHRFSPVISASNLYPELAAAYEDASTLVS